MCRIVAPSPQRPREHAGNTTFTAESWSHDNQQHRRNRHPLRPFAVPGHRRKPRRNGAAGSARDLYALAEEIARIALPHQKILIDDRVDIALALRARGVRIDGVHIGQDDLPVTDARRLLGEHAIIGLTTGTRELVERANTVAHLIDYIGAGPFRPSPTKASNRPPLGIEGLRELAELSKVPVVAIGDIWPQDCPSIRETGVAGVAMARAFVENPELQA